MVDTRGEGIFCARVIGFKPTPAKLKKRTGLNGFHGTGKALGFSLANLQNRGTLYIEPATEVYEGMVIGNTAKGNDWHVNPIKGKQLTNMRSSNADKAIQLTAPIKLTLERGMGVMETTNIWKSLPKISVCGKNI